MTTAGEGRSCGSYEYHRDRNDRSPFADKPSGSQWGRLHVCWLGIRHTLDCPAEDIFTKKSNLNQNGMIIKHLRENIMMPWDIITKGDHEPGSFYDYLHNLGAPVEIEQPYEPATVLPSSSMVAPSSSPDPDSPSRRSPQSCEALSPPKSSTSEPRRERPSRHSPSSRPNYREPSGSGSSSAPQDSTRDVDDEYHSELDPLSSESEAEDTDEPGKSYELEKDVEFAAVAFLNLLRSCFIQTGLSLSKEEKTKQGLTYSSKAPRKLTIIIDNCRMRSHPDVVLSLHSKNTLSEVIVEAKSLDSTLSPERILGQEISELLGAVLKYRRVWKREEYLAYLISWHHLTCYISRMRVTERYLDQLAKDSSTLPQKTPKVKRSKEFDLKDPQQRFEFGVLAARVAIELLYQYPDHQGNGSGLVRRLRSEQAF